MRRLLILLLVISTMQVFGQDKSTPNEWYQDFVTNNGLDKIDSKPEFVKYDFSKLFLATSTSRIYGVIGDNMQRIRIKWISINKDPNNPDKYYVYGKTKVKSNVCGFTGIIKVKSIRLYSEGKYDMPYESSIKPEKIGVLFCDYTLTENTNEKHTGVFQGISATDFYIVNDSLKYNDLRGFADGMTNNQFVGTWTSYSSKTSKLCNWGDFRVPNVSGFDCGAGEFSPCDDFLKYGWESFRVANYYGQESEDVKKAKEIEYAEWWK